MKSFFILFLLVILVFGCQPPQQSLTDVEKNAIKKEITGEFNKIVTAINQINFEEWSNFYSKDNFVSATVGTDFYDSRSTFIDSIKSYFSGRESQIIKPEYIRVTPLTTNLAFLTSEEKSEMKLKSGQNMNIKHVFTMIWEKEKDGWKIIHSHESWVDTKIQ